MPELQTPASITFKDVSTNTLSKESLQMGVLLLIMTLCWMFTVYMELTGKTFRDFLPPSTTPKEQPVVEGSVTP